MDSDAEYSSILIIVHRTNLLGNYPLTINRDTTAQSIDYIIWRVTVDEDFVFFLKFKLWMSNTKQQVSVVGQQQQT